MEKEKLIYIILGIAGAAIVIWLVITKLMPKTQTQQAGQIPAPVTSPPPTMPTPTMPTPTMPAFTVQGGSYLANFAGQPVTISSSPPQLQIGDSWWVGVQTPNATLALVPFPANVAQAKISQGLLAPNSSYVVQVVPGSFSAEMKMQSSAVYGAYGTQTMTLTAGVLRDIIRGNKSLFIQLYQAVASSNLPLVQQLIASLSSNPQLQQIAKTLSIPGNMVAPLAISYNAAITLGIVPPQIQSYITNPSAVVIDFGYV